MFVDLIPMEFENINSKNFFSLDTNDQRVNQVELTMTITNVELINPDDNYPLD